MMITDMSYNLGPSSAVRLSFTVNEIKAAVDKNLADVSKTITATKEKIANLLAEAKCDAPLEKIVEIVVRGDMDLDYAALDERADAIFSAARILQPLEGLRSMLELISKRGVYTGAEIGTVRLTFDDYYMLIAAFNLESALRNFHIPRSVRRRRQMGMATAVGRYGDDLGVGERELTIGNVVAAASVEKI